ncbi:DEAD/DEAH box helicase family protein [Furfurilactobacillus siliginis]|uniref:DNA endonuclease, type III restriction and modification system n=1 Tax=Furfurilactobacillus siliginis TaxID=348151 RepID=A0A0R2KVB4_9LACO|nr:DEAD/DEAH box helicase family protein [Furfurilactobacillus siliginis]KRN93401.1 DNA endonuclease, type III restriction and modification system [Furfurilactobacillus siliginis]GEK29552.1 type III restriction endonuclease subunit R [Furfurilactobacillus siliginis]
MAKKKARELVLPIVHEIKDYTSDFLKNDEPRHSFVYPDYIKHNLKHQLRDYQKQSLYNLNYTQKDDHVASRFNQLLFHMATGSGKTDVMAADILYFYHEFGYQNFLFIVNTNAVIAKTRENMLNVQSPKYLFSQPLSIDGETIELREVTRFPTNSEPGVIYLRLTTIQTLANELNTPRENGLTYGDLEKQKLIILADEAHHFSAGTKSKSDQKNKAWEYVLDRIRQANKANRQLEFTATIDLNNEFIYEKYRDKIIFQYDLKEFQNAGYSKKIARLQANADDNEKMLNAVLLSQYRKRMAIQAGVKDFKPVILFKSNRKDVSKAARGQFLTMMDRLTAEDLAQFIAKQLQTTQSSTLRQAYTYYQTVDMGSLVRELQRDFQLLNTIRVNDTSSDGILGDLNNFRNLNTLEEPSNPFRAIFSVVKLSEGWDVLNLYDIVRIGEQPITSTQTNSEAQLIGRGARYNPFVYEDATSFTRRFDHSTPELQILESLHYHTINDKKYIDNLTKSFEAMQLQVEDDKDFDILTTTVKKSFKKSNVYQYGKLYYNDVEDVPESEYNGLTKYGVPVAELPTVNIETATLEATAFDTQNVAGMNETRLVKIDEALVKKSMARNPFFRFNTMKKYMPTLNSISEFMYDAQWLGQLKEIQATVSTGADTVLSRETQLLVVEKYLAYIQRMLIMNYKRQRGTNKFIGLPIKEVVQDYQKRIPVNYSNASIHELIQTYDYKKAPWFVYNEAIVDKLERSLIELIQGYVEELQNKYKDVYLIRSDERNTKLKLHEFANNVSHYAGFLPDFVLYLANESYIYQIYIEPKGTQLLDQDQWKENLLTSISPDSVDVIGENEKVKLYGVRFYVSGDSRQIRKKIEIFTD